MLWFFVFPCVIFVGWASWKLVASVIQARPLQLGERIEQVRKARSSGDRWQAAYSLSQELHKMKKSGEWDSAPAADKKAAFTELGALLDENEADLRVKRYLLLAFGEFGDEASIARVEKSLNDSDSEIRFFASWSYVKLMERLPETATPVRLERVAAWMKGEDSSLRKVAASFLVQRPDDAYLARVEGLLGDADREVRWNAAVALASTGHASAAPVLKEIFNVETLRDAQLRTAEDLKQLVASAWEAANKLKDPDVIAAGRALKASVNAKTLEGGAIHAAIY